MSSGELVILCGGEYVRESFLVNRRSFINERYLSASLYRPNNGCVR